MQQYKLYTTIGCHLCEDVLAMFYAVKTDDISLVEIDIFHDSENYDDLWDKVPVIESPDKKRLYYPFTLNELAEFLAKV